MSDRIVVQELGQGAIVEDDEGGATFVLAGEDTLAAANSATQAAAQVALATTQANNAAASAVTSGQGRDVSIAAGVQYPSVAAAVAGLADGAFGGYLDASGNPVWGQRTGATMTPLPGPWIGADKVGFIAEGAGAALRNVLVKLRDESVSISDFTGFVGDGENDDTAAVVAAATTARATGRGLACPPGYTIRLLSSTDLTNIRDIDIRSNIVITTGTVTAGGNVNAGQFFVSFEGVTNGSSPLIGSIPASPVLRLTGVANSKFHVGSCNYLQLWADASVSNNRLFAYNNLDLTGAVRLFEITDSGTPLSYVNENTINALRIVAYRIIGVGYPHNHNELNGGTFEGSLAEITMTGDLVSCNTVKRVRFENAQSAPGVTFGEGTYSNTVISTWSGVGNPRNQFTNAIAVDDQGSGNAVTTQSAIDFRKTPIFEVGPHSQIIANASDAVALHPSVLPANAGVNNLVNRLLAVPSLAGVNVPQAFRWIALSDPIPVRLGDVVSWKASFNGALARTYIFVLDENMEPLLDNSGGDFVSQPGVNFSATHGSYAHGANASASALNSQPAAIIRSEVAYIRVGIAFGAAGFARFLGAYLHTQPLGRSQSEGGARGHAALRALNGIPTRGYVPLNTIIWDSAANAMRRCTFQYETRLSGALAAGATAATVAAASTIANGDIVGILLDDQTTHWTTVSTLSGATFTIDAIPAGRSAPDGGRIVFNRWAS